MPDRVRKPESVAAGRDWPSLRFRAMGTDCLLMSRPGPRAADVFGRARAEIERLESKFSRFRPDSELSRLNRSGGGEMSSEMTEVVATALAMRDETEGLFDPTLLAEIRAAGYDRDFAQVLRGQRLGDAAVDGPSIAGVRRPRAGGRLAEVKGRSLSLAPGTGLDLGGIGKGWCAERVAESVAVGGGLLVDLGGDCAVRGPGPADGAWPVGIDHGGDDVTVVEIVDSALCTSTTRLHRWAGPVSDAHHLIDPTTGRPAETDIASATVWDPSAARAEAWAKAIVIGGLARGLLAAADEGLDAVATGGLGGVYATGPLFEGVPGARTVAAATSQG